MRPGQRVTPMFHLKRDLSAEDINLLRRIASRLAILREHERLLEAEAKRDVYGRDWKDLKGAIETDEQILDDYLKVAHADRLIMPLDTLV